MSANILVIDDDPETLNLIRLILGKEGYNLTVTQSGQDGIRMAKANPPDLLLVDIMMPGMDGYEVCRRFRATPTLAKIPIIIFTAKVKPEDKASGFLVGADDFLTKPTTPDELVDRVQVQLARNAKPSDTGSVISALANAGKIPKRPEQIKKKNSFIGILGVRGGVGTTTIAINLAASAAKAGNGTILVDFDWQQGHIAQYLNQQTLTGLHQIEQHLSLEQLLTGYQPNLDLILHSNDLLGKKTAPDPPALEQLARELQHSGKTVIADLGRGLNEINLPILPYLDQLILCLRPERLALTATRRLVNEARQILGDTAFLHLIMISFNASSALPRTAIENSLKHPLLDLLVIRNRDLAHATNKAEPLVTLLPDSPTAEEFNLLAHKLTTM
jgi:CheY-like chemotaxis protein/MinD-like ATPase involved in chromosome partitioning or flagellar assembly